MSGKSAGIAGKAAGVVIIILVVAFAVWIFYEIPSYERQQARLNLENGQEYWRQNDYENALQSFMAVKDIDEQTYEQVQPYIAELQKIVAENDLARAKDFYSSRQYSDALSILQKSMSNFILPEAQELLPMYTDAAGD
jgi:Tfp pilus assembly protein PilF